MADLDDEDIFADLYDGDDTVDIAPQAKAPAPAPAAVSQPVQAQSAVAALPAPVQEAIQKVEAPGQISNVFANGNGVPQPNAANPLQNMDWSNQGQGQAQAPATWESQHQEETERPIGSKEDGDDMYTVNETTGAALELLKLLDGGWDGAEA